MWPFKSKPTTSAELIARYTNYPNHYNLLGANSESFGYNLESLSQFLRKKAKVRSNIRGELLDSGMEISADNPANNYM